MARSERNPGAVPERLAREGDTRCEAVLFQPPSGERSDRVIRCAYKLGHDGPHYCRGEIW